MNKIEAYKKINKINKRIFTTLDLRKILDIEKDNTLYKQIERLVATKMLNRIKNGLYSLSDRIFYNFELANYLYFPSYVSLETALCFYGILIQSPQQIMSVTTKKTNTIMAEGQEFVYMHLDRNYYSDYQKIDDFVIATPEKALIDTMFFASLGKTRLSFEELILNDVNKKKLVNMAKVIKNKAFQKYFRTIKSCFLKQK